MRSTGRYVVSTTLNESVRAFVPHALPPAKPALALDGYAQANRQAELALARLSGVAGLVPMMPRFTIEHVRQKLDTTFPTATAAVKMLEYLGLVTEQTGQKKNRSYSYQGYVELLTR